MLCSALKQMIYIAFFSFGQMM